MMKNILALMVGLVLAFLVGELACRFLLPVSSVRYYYDREIGTTLAPGSRMRWVSKGDFNSVVLTNTHGFHDREHAYEKEKEVFRVVVLGDSFMEALQVPIEEGFCQRLEEDLKRLTGKNRIEVINLGLSGRGPAQHYAILKERGLKYRPDLVIMALLPGNDFSDTSFEISQSPYKPYYWIDEMERLQARPLHVPPWYSPRSLLQRSSLAYYLVYEILKNQTLAKGFTGLGLIPRTTGSMSDNSHGENEAKPPLPFTFGLYQKEPPPLWKEAYRVTLRMIAEARDLSRLNHAGFFVFTIPVKADIEMDQNERLASYKEENIDFMRPFKEIQTYCDEKDIPCLDLTGPFREEFGKHGRSFTWSHDGHWNPYGHDLAARLVALKLVQSGLIHLR